VRPGIDIRVPIGGEVPRGQAVVAEADPVINLKVIWMGPLERLPELRPNHILFVHADDAERLRAAAASLDGRPPTWASARL